MDAVHGPVAGLQDQLVRKAVLPAPALDVAKLGGSGRAAGDAEGLQDTVAAPAVEGSALLCLLRCPDLTVRPGQGHLLYVVHALVPVLHAVLYQVLDQVRGHAQLVIEVGDGPHIRGRESLAQILLRHKKQLLELLAVAEAGHVLRGRGRLPSLPCLRPLGTGRHIGLDRGRGGAGRSGRRKHCGGCRRGGRHAAARAIRDLVVQKPLLFPVFQSADHILLRVVQDVRNAGYGQLPVRAGLAAQQKKIDLHVLSVCLRHIVVNEFEIQQECLVLPAVFQCQFLHASPILACRYLSYTFYRRPIIAPERDGQKELFEPKSIFFVDKILWKMWITSLSADPLQYLQRFRPP